MENILGTVINWFTGKGKGKGEGESTSTECPLCETLGRTCAAHSRSSKGKGKPKVVLTDLTNEQRKVLKEYLGEEYEEVMDLLAGDQDQLNKITEPVQPPLTLTSESYCHTRTKRYVGW